MSRNVLTCSACVAVLSWAGSPHIQGAGKNLGQNKMQFICSLLYASIVLHEIALNCFERYLQIVK